MGRLKDDTAATEGDKPQFKPSKTTLDSDACRATIKIEVPNYQATSYIYSNYSIHLGWYGGVVVQTVTDFRADFHEGKEGMMGNQWRFARPYHHIKPDQ